MSSRRRCGCALQSLGPDGSTDSPPRPTARLGFLEIRWRYRPAAIGALERWLHTWPGLGAVVTGMHAQGCDVELRQLGADWHATFYPVGLAHSIVLGTAREPTPWRAAVWAALNDPRVSGWILENEQYGVIVKKWLNDNPRNLNPSARVSVLIALIQAFPCSRC